MKRYLILFILIFFLKTAFTQNCKVFGKIKAKNSSENIEFAKVILDGLQITFTDNLGYFSFENADTGLHQIKIIVLGYEEYSNSIKIMANVKNLDLNEILLNAKTIRIKEITIYGNADIYSLYYEGSNINISPKTIKNIRPLGTEEILKLVPGVNISGDMGISNRLNVGIRGSYPRRSVNILLLEDGTPIAPAPYLGPEAYYNPPGDRIDAIEVIKGSDVIAFGTNTMYGAINYITKKPPVKPTLSVNLSSGNNNYFSEYITYGGTWNNIGTEIQILKKDFGGFQKNSQSDIFNITAKIYSELSNKSSFYVKLNYNNEKSKATYSALTPLTFKNDATQNPFDADDLLTKRYAIDLIYNFKTNCGFLFSTKLYASQFQRDWWRQENTLVKASALKNYVGEKIYGEKYSYLDNVTLGEDDYVRVGKISSGKEQTRARNRLFKVFGLQESIKQDFNKFGFKTSSELILRSHFEFFDNIEIKNDSSKFSRSGILDKDNFYELAANSIYFKSKIEYNAISFTPHLRFENVTMYSFDRLAISKNPENDGSRYFGSLKNNYQSFTPGISANYILVKNKSNNINIIAGIYRGYNAPTAEAGFMNVEDDVVKKATSNQDVNRKPETSINYESGFRGNIIKNLVAFQAIYFNNTVSNYYSAGRNEAFQTLGKVNIHGFETSVSIDVNKFLCLKKQEIVLSFAGTFMSGKILEGVLTDTDILKAKHNQLTKNEIIEKVNSERSGYNIYINSKKNTDSLITRNITVNEFSAIKRIDYVFGDGNLKNNNLPYIPKSIISTMLSYKYNNFSILFTFNYVSSQFTDYLNLTNETSEGAIGQLKAYTTADINMSYSFAKSKYKSLKGTCIFFDCKNLTSQVYAASRLHRVSSGIMPGGFRQINTGIKINIL